MKYYTTKNMLTNDGSYIARVVVNKIYTEDEIIDKVLKKRNLVSKPDLRGVMSALKDTFVDIIKEGNGMNLPWMKVSFSMKGNFKAADTQRDPEQNPLEVNLNAGSLLTDALAEVELERMTKPSFGPVITRFFDAGSQTDNSQITPGGMFEIVGERVRIDGPQARTIGLFLSAEDGTETKVEKILRNDPSYLSGTLPDTLPTGKYKIVIKTQVGAGSSGFLTEARVGISEISLTVK
jgi:hypothetical protein